MKREEPAEQPSPESNELMVTGPSPKQENLEKFIPMGLTFWLLNSRRRIRADPSMTSIISLLVLYH